MVFLACVGKQRFFWIAVFVFITDSTLRHIVLYLSGHAWPVKNVPFSVFKCHCSQVRLMNLVQYFLSHLDWND